MFEQVEVNSERWLNLKPLKNEKFRDIPEYEGIYQVSNYGRVKSLERYHILPNGGIWKIENKILKSYHDNGRYSFVALYNGTKRQIKVHRLVAQVFIPNPNNLPEVNHIDCVRDNNMITNLEWCDRSYNTKYAFKYGTKNMPDKLKKMIKNFDGENNPNSKLKKEDVIDIRKQISNGISYKKIAQQYNLHPDYIFLIKNRKIWKKI